MSLRRILALLFIGLTSILPFVYSDAEDIRELGVEIVLTALAAGLFVLYLEASFAALWTSIFTESVKEEEDDDVEVTILDEDE